MLMNDLSQKNAFWAVNNINEIVGRDYKGLNESESNFRLWNSKKILKGYFLKLNTEKQNKENSSKKESIKQFCDFLKNEAFWYD